MSSRTGAVLAVVAVLAVILHGSLWPYEFVDPGGAGPVATFVRSIGGRPHLTDFVANLLLYLPLGVALLVAVPGSVARRAVLATLIGAVVSFGVEMTQYYEPARVTDFYDLVANAAGTALGVVVALAVGASTQAPFLGRFARAPVPTMLLGAMLGYRLSPYVPAADLHKYWQAIKPLLALPWPEPLLLFRYAVIWLAAAEYLAEILGGAASLLALPVLGAFVLAAKVSMVGAVVSPAEVVALPCVFLAWVALHRLGHSRVVLMAALLFVQVGIDRLHPFAFQAEPRPFGWLPFRGFLAGSLAVNTASFFEKLFLYGGLFWLLCRAGVQRGLAAGSVALLLLLTSVAEMYLPGRSAEITDALMAVISAGLLVWLGELATSGRAPAGVMRGMGGSSLRGGAGR